MANKLETLSEMTRRIMREVDAHYNAHPEELQEFAERFTLYRGGKLRPLAFDGVVVGKVETNKHRVAIYRTRGGKYVSEFCRLNCVSDKFIKVEVHGSLDDACAWFRPGILTAQLLIALGRWEPEVLE